MTEQGVFNIGAAVVGVGIMLAFHFHSRKNRSLTTEQRMRLKEERNRWLGGKSLSAKCYKILLAFLFLCACAHAIMSVGLRNEERRKYIAADGNVILRPFKIFCSELKTTYEFEVFNGTLKDIWVPLSNSTIFVRAVDMAAGVVINTNVSAMAMERVKPRRTAYLKLISDATNIDGRISALYYDNSDGSCGHLITLMNE